MDKMLGDIRVVDLTDHIFGSYCTMIIAAHGGSIDVESRVEEGSRITIRFSAYNSDID